MICLWNSLTQKVIKFCLLVLLGKNFIKLKVLIEKISKWISCFSFPSSLPPAALHVSVLLVLTLRRKRDKMIRLCLTPEIAVILTWFLLEQF